MGTAVVHPQDYLTGDQNRRFWCVSDSPSSIARHAGRPFSATYEPSIPATERGTDVAEGNMIPNRGRGLLSCKNLSSGLLPLPDQALQSAHNTYSRLSSKIPACQFGEIVDSYGSNHFASSHHSKFSSYPSEVRISRRPSVPMLDHAARTQSFLSECFPLHHARRPLRHVSRDFFNSAQVVASLSCAGGTRISCQKLKVLANSHFSDVFNPVHLNRADSIDQSIHYKKRMHPELCQVEVYLGTKPPFNVLPDGQGKSFCTKTSTVGRKFDVNKQLQRSASEKLQGPVLQRPGSKEVTRKLKTRSPEGVVRSHTGTYGSSKIEVKSASSAPPSSSLEGKIEKGPRMQVSLDVDTPRRMCLSKTGTARSSQETSFQQMGCTLRNVGASLSGKCHGSANAAVEHKEVDKDVNKGNVTSTFDNQSAVSNIKKPSTVVAPEEILRSRRSVLDNDEMWVSMMNDEKWAGPSFFNSPSPSSLPVPSFTFLVSRTLPAGSRPAQTADCGANMVSDISSLEAKRTWDVAFATKDLRRMLHLDHASCNP